MNPDNLGNDTNSINIMDRMERLTLESGKRMNMKQDTNETFGELNQEQMDAAFTLPSLREIELISDANWYKNEYRSELDAYENQTVEEIANELITKLEADSQTGIQSITIRRNRRYEPTMAVLYKPSRRFYDLAGDNS